MCNLLKSIEEIENIVEVIPLKIRRFFYMEKRSIVLGTTATPIHKQQIEKAIQQIKGYRPTLSTWILTAIEEKLERDLKVVDDNAKNNL